jgi:hypothetical protein
MPPGWKPGDPIPLPDIAALQQAAAAAAQQAAAPEAGAEEARPPTAAPAKPLLQRPQFDASFLMMDNDYEVASEEDFSSDEDSGED